MDSAAFRNRLARLGLSIAQLADTLASLGDTRPRATIERTLYELASPSRTAPAPWAIAVILTLLEERQTE
jgi:hypothetical protein